MNEYNGNPWTSHYDYLKRYFSDVMNDTKKVYETYKGYTYRFSNDYGTSINNIPKIDHIQVNGDITTIIWTDKTHTIVKKAADEEYDPHTAIVYAIVKKLTGNTSGSLNRFFKEADKRVVTHHKN